MGQRAANNGRSRRNAHAESARPVSASAIAINGSAT